MLGAFAFRRILHCSVGSSASCDKIELWIHKKCDRYRKQRTRKKKVRAILKKTTDELQAEVASIKSKALEDEVLRAMSMTNADWLAWFDENMEQWQAFVRTCPEARRALTMRLQLFGDARHAKRLQPHNAPLDFPQCGSVSFWLPEMVFTFCSSADNSLICFTEWDLLGVVAGAFGPSFFFIEVATVAGVFPKVGVVANAGFDPRSDDVRVCSCVLSFVDSTDERIYEPRFDNSVEDSDSDDEESGKVSRGRTSPWSLHRHTGLMFNYQRTRGGRRQQI